MKWIQERGDMDTKLKAIQRRGDRNTQNRKDTEKRIQGQKHQKEYSAKKTRTQRTQGIQRRIEKVTKNF